VVGGSAGPLVPQPGAAGLHRFRSPFFVFGSQGRSCTFGVLAGGGRRGYNGNMRTVSGPSKSPPQTPPEPTGAIRAAVEYGIDVEMLRANLALTPAERLRRHQMALNTVEMLRKAKRG